MEESKYKLGENSIHVIGSHGVEINEKIFDNELFGYSIIDREGFIDTLIGWISEAESSDKFMMKLDLKTLMRLNDDYMFSSTSTNEYVGKEDSNFNELCEELIELNKITEDGEEEAEV